MEYVKPAYLATKRHRYLFLSVLIWNRALKVTNFHYVKLRFYTQERNLKVALELKFKERERERILTVFKSTIIKFRRGCEQQSLKLCTAAWPEYSWHIYQLVRQLFRPGNSKQHEIFWEKLTSYSTYKNFHLFMFFSSFFSNIPLNKNKL